MDKIKSLLNLALSSDRNILITAIIIVFSIVVIANVFGRLATASIAFFLIFCAIIIAPKMLKDSYKKFNDKEDKK
jgi:hypothetical protein